MIPYSTRNRIFRYGTKSRLLLTNWLPFDINLKFRIADKRQWNGKLYPQNIRAHNLSSYSSTHQTLSLKQFNSVYTIGNFGRFSVELSSQQMGEAKLFCNQVNAYGVWSYNLSYTMYLVRHRSGLHYNIYEIMGRDKPQNWRWMEQLLQKKPNLRVNQITMPGSHDSGMIINRFSFIKRVTQNQYDDILGQLKAGVRYFDIRLTYKNGEYVTYHGGDMVCGIGVSLQSIIDDINAFFKHHGPNETVFFVVSRTRKEMRPEKRHQMIRKINSEIINIANLENVTEHSLASEKLLNLRGKTVLVYDHRDFVGNTEPITKFEQFKDQQDEKWHDPHKQFLKVYDSYSNTNLIDDMVQDQNIKLQKFGGYGKNYLFLYSFTLTVQSALRMSPQHYSIELLGNISRALLPIQLKKMRDGELKKPNIIYYDFVDSWSCAAIIQLNH